MRMWMLRRRGKMMMLRRKSDPKTGKHTLPEPALSKCTRTGYKSHFVEIYKKMPDPNPGDIVLCQPAQSKCTWTFHKSHFVPKFTGNWPDPNPATRFVRACAVEMRMDISQEPFRVEI